MWCIISEEEWLWPTPVMSEAKQQLLSPQLLLKDSSLVIPHSPFSPAVDGGIVAEQLLAGTIALKENRLKEAVPFPGSFFLEESMAYNEPRDWLLNPKHYLGYAAVSERWQTGWNGVLEGFEEQHGKWLGFVWLLPGITVAGKRRKLHSCFFCSF